MAYTKAGIRFSRESYVLVDASGGTIERKRLWDNPNPNVEMTDVDMFNESELEGYDYIAFTITSTNSDYDVEEWCEIAPLKAHGGQFVISYPITNTLYCRKIYRSSGVVRPSTWVYDIGKTTGDKNYCIIKSVDAVKLNKGE